MANHPNRSRAPAARITKHKDQYGWRVHVDGRPTAMLVCKDPAPRWGAPQTYFITTDDDQVLIEARSVSALMERLERLRRELATPSPSIPTRSA